MDLSHLIMVRSDLTRMWQHPTAPPEPPPIPVIRLRKTRATPVMPPQNDRMAAADPEHQRICAPTSAPTLASECNGVLKSHSRR